MERIIILTGAGMSAESGIKTFRDNNGLWEEHDVMEVASPTAWDKNPELVLRFYNLRRQQLKEVAPNTAHRALVDLEEHYDVRIITQNVDDLHERAGSSQVIHLHGELRKVRSTSHPEHVYAWEKDLHWGDCCEKSGAQLRPHIVWFGEAVPMMEHAVREIVEADRVIIIGTSMQVYPAAGLIGFAPGHIPVHYVDPNPSVNYELQRSKELQIIAEAAGTGVPELVQKLIGRASK